MKIVFAGTPEIALPTLEALLTSEHEVIAVYTQPDKVSGRGRHLSMSPVKEYALKHNIPIFQPTSLKAQEEQEHFKSLKPDLMVVVAYGLILPKAILETPTFGCINVHVSLLPRWRGASPIQQAILAGDKETGVSIMQMDVGLDTGPIFEQRCCEILPTDTAGVLHDRLAQLGAEALVNVLPKLGQIIPQNQNEEGTCYAGKIAKQDGLINWKQTAVEIERKVRAFNPWPVAYCYIDGEYVRVWAGEVVNENIFRNNLSEIGSILTVSSKGIDVLAGDKSIFRITQLQLANAKVLSVQAYLNASHSLFMTGKKFDSNELL